MKKLVISLVLCAAIMLSAAPFASAAQTSIVNPAQLKDYSVLQRRNGYSPITIVEAALSRGGGTEEIYLIVLDGLCPTVKNPNRLSAVALSSLSLSSEYLRTLKTMVNNNVPKRSKIVIFGYSLGGMIAQQFAADKKIKADYEIIHTVTAGSPKVLTASREGGISRLALDGDLAPYLPALGVIPFSGRFFREAGDYGLAFWLAHSGGYGRSDIWGAYDCLGIKGGTATVTIAPDAKMFTTLYKE